MTIQEIEQLIRAGDHIQAEEKLQQLLEMKPEDGQLWFNNGVLLMLRCCYPDAEISFRKSITLGYKTYKVLSNLASVLERNGKSVEAENTLLEAISCAEESNGQATVYLLLCKFYLDHGLFQKAEDAAAKIITLYPDQYEGHHMMVLAWEKAGMTEKVKAYLAKIEERFSQEEQYQIDRMENMIQAGEYTNILEYLREHPEVEQMMPEICLDFKTRIYIKRKNLEKVIQTTKTLFTEYGNEDRRITLITAYVMNNENEKAAQLANDYLIRYADSQDHNFFIVMFLDLIIYYRLYDGEYPDSIKGALKDMAAMVYQWFGNGTESEQQGRMVKDSLKQMKLL